MSMPGKGNKHHHLQQHHHQQHHQQQAHQQQQQAHQQQQAIQQQAHQQQAIQQQAHQQQAHQQQAHQQQVHQQQVHQQQVHQQQVHQQQQIHQGQHIVNVNVSQPGVAHSPQAYNSVAANQQRFVPHAGSEFHVPGQNYGAQPGGQVGGGGGNVGVPGGRGPPPLGGIQSLGQSTTGLPPGGPAAGQQAPPQPPTPGVQSQQPQGPAPTTTPPVHTPSPQEMGKQGHIQTQPIPVFVPNPQRAANQGYYASAPRPQQPRGMNHRGGQSGGNAQVLNMTGVAGNGTQQLQYAHPNMSAMYVQSQVSGLQHQQPVNFQIPTMQFRAPHQAHHNQGQNAFYQAYHHPATTIIAPNIYAFQPPHQTPYYQVNPAAYLRNATANAVNSNTQHMQGQLANAQGNSVVPQGSLQQPAQPPQPMPAMTMPIAQTEVYSGHNGGAPSSASNVASKKTRRSHAIPIIDPKTGASISNELYESDGSLSGEGAPHVQNCDKAVIADFAAMVAKAATEPSSDSPVATSAPESPTSQNRSQSLPPPPPPPNLKVQTNPNADTTNNSQSNTGPPTPTPQQSSIPPGAFSPNSQSSLPTSSNPAQLESCPVKVAESKPLQPSIKEFQPRGTDKPVVTEELPSQTTSSSVATLANKDKIPTQTPPPVAAVVAAAAAAAATANVVPAPEVEVKSTILPQVTSQTQIPSASPSSNIPDLPLPSATVVGANPVPAKEPFPNLGNKNKSSSPPRRKSQQNPASNAITIPEMPPLHKEPKEQRERKVNEKNVSSRGATPTPVHSSQPEHIHQKINGETGGDKPETETLPKNEAAPQKTSDGGKSAMQKQKNKSKLKDRDINRRGAEKEGTDMDAFVNAIPPTKVESKPEIKEAAPQRDSNKESAPKEITKDIKEKDNHESKKEKQATRQPQEKQTTPEVSKESSTPIIENPPASFNHKESKPTIEESSKAPVVVSNMAPVPNDVVDHSVSMKSDIELTSIVAQKNEENSKVSALRAASEEKVVPVIEKQDENAAPNQLEPSAPKGPVLKYTYQDDQWSPLNKDGKRVYGREFLMKLQEDPNSKIKPLNLPDLDVVLKDSTKVRQYTSRNRSPELRPFKDQNMGRHDNLFPGFANANKNSMNSRMGMLPTNKKSNSGSKPNRINNSNKPNVISLSLGGEVKLRESENAWKPTRLKAGDIPEEQAVTQTLYKKVRSVLNKLTPQKFDTLVSQVRALAIDTKERMDGVINLVFEKAIDEPSFSVAYALMCKELALMQVSGTEPGDSSATNFRKSIITRCQSEFEKDSENEKLRVTKAKEIEECTDPEKQKELQAAYEEEERRIRMKSVGNIRFIGELFKQGMLTKKIMHFCINHLLQHRDEENLECLCKLLTTIGKNLETNDDLKDYIKIMQSIVNDKGPNKISSRVRFMIQDVIDLRSNKWVPRRDDSNPKTMDQIQREAESERLDAQFNTPFNTPMNTPRKDDRGSDRRRNRGMGGGNSEDGGWIHPSKTTRTAYSVETSKLKNKPPSMDDLQLGSRNAYVFHKNVPTGGTSVKTVTPNKFACLENMSSFEQDKRPPLQLSGSRSTGPREYGRSDYKSSFEGRSSRNGSHQLSSGSSSRESSVLDNARSQSISMPPPSKPAPPPTSISNKPEKSEDELRNVINMIVEEYVAEGNNEDVLLEVKENFSSSQLPMLVREMVNAVIEKSSMARERISKLLSFLLLKKAITLNNFRDGFGEILDIIDDLVIDIPKIWTYLADIMMYLVIDGTHPFSELKTTVATLRSKGLSGKLIGELFSNMSRIIGQKSVAEKWSQSGLQFSDIINTERENVDEIIKKHELQFLLSDCKDLENKAVLNLEHIHTHLKKMMKDSSSFDDICNWITSNVGDRSSDPQFIRVLMTAILETSTVFSNNRHDFKADIFQSLQRLIQRFVDANEKLELECLFAAQAFANKLEFPSGLLLNIFDKLCEDNIISFESFIQWETNDDAAEREGKAVALKALTSFFTSLKEAEEVSEEESMTSGQSASAVRA